MPTRSFSDEGCFWFHLYFEFPTREKTRFWTVKSNGFFSIVSFFTISTILLKQFFRFLFSAVLTIFPRSSKRAYYLLPGKRKTTHPTRIYHAIRCDSCEFFFHNTPRKSTVDHGGRSFSGRPCVPERYFKVK